MSIKMKRYLIGFLNTTNCLDQRWVVAETAELACREVYNDIANCGEEYPTVLKEEDLTEQDKLVK